MVIPVYDKNPVRRTPVVTYGLIALCTAVFLLGPLSGFLPAYGTGHTLACRQALWFDRWGVVPAELFHTRPSAAALGLPAGCGGADPYPLSPYLSVFTSMFLHGSWLHLIGNMLFLYVFGDNVENRMGRVRFALFYLAAGYLATYGFALAHTTDTQSLVGASGAISGALGAYLYLYPRARVTSLFPFLFFVPLRFPAWVVLGFWFVLQWFAAQSAAAGPGVAYLAHVVGFALGFCWAWACYRPRSKLSVIAGTTQGDAQP
ncbi:rhomboid family intramembrane serine protease [Streptomyces sp. NPDC021224]|uniref:rhomboid family intramembrane serine protease n=1 Tax=unclassified Streptomyces TaxID=2593676 RepID=UPI0037AD3DC5